MRAKIWALLERRPVRAVTLLSAVGCIPGFMAAVVWGLVTRQWAMVITIYVAWLIGGLATLPTLLQFEREGASKT